SDDDRDVKKSLLYRAARTFDTQARDKVRAEEIYAQLVAIDPSDEIAASALEDVRKALGKFEELIEMLLERSQSAPAGEGRARVLADVGRIFANDVEDSEQAVVAFVQALCETPSNDEYASEIERLAARNNAMWTEQLGALTETIKSGTLGPADQVALLG